MFPEAEKSPVRSVQALIFLLAVLLVCAGALTGYTAWKKYDRHQFRPVLAMDFESFECDADGNLIAHGWLVKQQIEIYGRPNWAKIIELTVFNQSQDIVIHLGRDELRNRPGGFQQFSPFLPIPGACNGSFEIHTLHEHPEDPSIILRQGWGPFGPGVDLPQPRQLY